MRLILPDHLSRPLGVTLLAAALGLTLPGCRQASEGAADHTLVLAVRADITGVFPNPPLLNEIYSLHVNGNIFEGLVRFDRNHNLQPALAERWENPDTRTTVFVLRRGLRFSNGQPVTAQDVAASLEGARTRKWPTRDYFQAVESVRALDAERVEVVTRFRTLRIELIHLLKTRSSRNESPELLHPGN